MAARAGVSQSNLSAYEQGRRALTQDMFDRLMMAMAPRPSHLVDRHRQEMRDVIHRHKGRDPQLFGSVARDEDSPSSDVDLLVTFEPGTTFFDVAAMGEELESLLGTKVDIVSRRALGPADRHILEEAVAL